MMSQEQFKNSWAFALAGALCIIANTAAAQEEAAIWGAVGNTAYNTEVRDTLICTGEFSTLDYFEGSTSSPTVSDLQAYGAVLVFSDTAFADPEAMGDILADYVDYGRGVVIAAGAFAQGNTALAGRIVDEGYMPLTMGTAMGAPGGNLEIAAVEGQEEHQIMHGVNAFFGGSSIQVSGSSLSSDAELVAEWSNGEPAVVTKEIGNGRVVALNLFPPSSISNAAFWDIQTYGDHLIANALLWAMDYERPDSTCYNEVIEQDLNCNGIDAADEQTVDIEDEVCMENIDPNTGEPYVNADYYYDYWSFGCEMLVGPDAGYDNDFDALGAGTVELFAKDADFPSFMGMLLCDNCPDDSNLDQQDVDCDGFGDLCDNCLYVGNPTQKNSDYDCWGDDCDNCPLMDNTDQADTDTDFIGDICDNCPYVENADQGDLDEDWSGDACDNCPELYNPDQGDLDMDGVGNLCDNCLDAGNPFQADQDEDEIGDACDNCPQIPSQDQTDIDDDGRGDICDNCAHDANYDQLDDDQDDVGNACDNCPNYANNTQSDLDADEVGDVCDVCPELSDPEQIDTDLDGVGDICDNCPFNPNDQDDLDEDGFGDDCDLCPTEGCIEGIQSNEFGFNERCDYDEDGVTDMEKNIDSDSDGFGDTCDNCPNHPNPLQLDEDDDGRGNICDELALRGGGQLTCSSVPGAPAPWSLIGLIGLLGLMVSRRRYSASS